LFPTDIRELPGAKALNSFKDATIYRVPKVEKYVKTVFGKAASAKMLVKGDPTSRFKAVENVKRLLDSVGNKIDPETYNRVLGQAAYAYGETGGINAIYDTRVPEARHGYSCSVVIAFSRSAKSSLGNI